MFPVFLCHRKMRHINGFCLKKKDVKKNNFLLAILKKAIIVTGNSKRGGVFYEKLNVKIFKRRRGERN